MSKQSHNIRERPEPISCWRVYPQGAELFADESLLPDDSSILIRQDEETDEYLRGYLTHPKYGNGLNKATFRKENLVGWREEVVIPKPDSGVKALILRKLRSILGVSTEAWGAASND